MLQYGQTALFNAAEEGHADTVKMLVDYGATVDIRDEVSNCFISCFITCFITFYNLYEDTVLVFII